MYGPSAVHLLVILQIIILIGDSAVLGLHDIASVLFGAFVVCMCGTRNILTGQFTVAATQTLNRLN